VMVVVSLFVLFMRDEEECIDDKQTTTTLT
jgi:hypothetical protein